MWGLASAMLVVLIPHPSHWGSCGATLQPFTATLFTEVTFSDENNCLIFLGKAPPLCLKHASKQNKYKSSLYTTLFINNH